MKDTGFEIVAPRGAVRCGAWDPPGHEAGVRGCRSAALGLLQAQKADRPAQGASLPDGAEKRHRDKVVY